ncbi:MAG: O-antigen ligase family protein [Clostridiaceae bacterium]
MQSNSAPKLSRDGLLAEQTNLGLRSWQLPAVLVFICCIIVSVYQYYSLKYADLFLASVLFPASVGVFALILYTRPFLKYSEVKLLGVLFVWMVLGLFFNDWRLEKAFSNTWFYCACVTTFLCFSLPYAFDKETLKKALSILAVAMLASATLLSAAALAIVFGGVHVPEAIAKIGYVGLNTDGRLWMVSHPNTVAPICGAAIILAGYLLTRTKKWLTRAFLILCAVVCYSAMSLTDSRTGILSTTLGVALEFFLLFNLSFAKIKRAGGRILLSLAAAALCIGVFYFGTNIVRFVYNNTFVAHSATDDATVEDAAVEDAASSNTVSNPNTETDLAVNRGLDKVDSFNGRTEIWKGALRGLKENPDILLTGTTPIISGSVMAQYFPKNSPIGNFHSSFVAALVSFGIPGFAVMLAFFVMLAISAARLSFTKLLEKDSLAARMVPAILLFAVSESMMEVFLFVEFSLNVVWIWFLFAAGFVFRMQKSE